MTMTEEARMARNEYARKWRAEHKENVKRINQRFWEKKAREAAAAAQASGQDPEELTEDQNTGTGSDDLTDDQLRELCNRKREQVKGA